MTTAAIEQRFKTYANFIKIEHTIFSLPLIFAGALLNVQGWPSGRLLGLILLAAVGGRVMAMGLNRSFLAWPDAYYPCVCDHRRFEEYEPELKKVRCVLTLAGRPWGSPVRLLGGVGHVTTFLPASPIDR